jgi:serine/threonine protein kinase
MSSSGSGSLPSWLDRIFPVPLAAEAGAETGLSQRAARLAEELAARWRRGERVKAEQILEQTENLELALPVIYEEICQRLEQGEADAAARVLARFPHWQRELSLLLDCHQLLERDSAQPREILNALGPGFLKVGETLGEFRILAELGKGAVGGVYLAVQPTLGDRPVVLKVTPQIGQEHVALARMQHTHIVPLYSAFEDEARNLRVLCMPYFGGASLSRLLALLDDVPVGQRTGCDLVRALSRVQSESPLVLSPAERGPREALSRASYVQAMCWIGACLADALQAAHERDLLHLDIKLPNVLITAEGVPMLLDFHLARGSLVAGAQSQEFLGGTPLCMAPEQARAFHALRDNRPSPVGVDGRADIYSLGLLLYTALGGPWPVDIDAPASLHRHNPQVSRSLSDLLHRCLARDPRQRYPSAAALAEDLRRHLADRPLRGVPNRSLVERWRKWRRRNPAGLLVVAMLLILASVAAGLTEQFRRRQAEPARALETGRALLQKGLIRQAREELRRGRDLAADLPFAQALRQDLEAELKQARRLVAAEELHELAERIRFAALSEDLPDQEIRDLEQACWVVWKARNQLLEGPALPNTSGEELYTDLFDLALIRANLLARREEEEKALRVLAEAEKDLGTSPFLEYERARLMGQFGMSSPLPRTPWEYILLGRARYRSGQYEQALSLFSHASEQRPQSFWPHFYRGMCLYRLSRYEEAVTAFTVCVALSPDTAACYYNRALAWTARGRTDRARADYNRAQILKSPERSVKSQNQSPRLSGS